MLDIGFTRSPNKATLYVKKNGNDLLVVSMYVDDILVIGSKEGEVEEFKASMMSTLK